MYDGILHTAFLTKPKRWWYEHAYQFWPEFFRWPPGTEQVTDSMMNVAWDTYNLFWAVYWLTAAVLLLIGCWNKRKAPASTGDR